MQVSVFSFLFFYFDTHTHRMKDAQFCVRLPCEDDDRRKSKLRRTYATLLSFACRRSGAPILGGARRATNMSTLRNTAFTGDELDVYRRKARNLSLHGEFAFFRMGIYGRYTSKPEWEDWVIVPDKETDVGISIAADLFQRAGLDMIVASYLEDEDWLLMTTYLDWDDISPTLTPFIKRVVARAIGLRGCVYGCQKRIDDEDIFQSAAPRRWMYKVKTYPLTWWAYQERFGMPISTGMKPCHRGRELEVIEDDDICWFDDCDCDGYHPA